MAVTPLVELHDQRLLAKEHRSAILKKHKAQIKLREELQDDTREIRQPIPPEAYPASIKSLRDLTQVDTRLITRDGVTQDLRALSRYGSKISKKVTTIADMP